MTDPMVSFQSRCECTGVCFQGSATSVATIFSLALYVFIARYYTENRALQFSHQLWQRAASKAVREINS